MKAAGIALAIIVACAAWGQSQPPTPCTGKVCKEQQNIPAASNDGAGTHKQSASLPSVIVELSNPPTGDSIATEIKKNRLDQAAEDWHSFVFNSLLVGVGILQFIALMFTVFVTNKAANAAKKSADIAERALVELERPFVYGRISKQGVAPVNTPIGRDLMRGQIELCIENVGSTPANLTRIQWGISTAPHGGIPDPLDATAVGGRELPISTIAIKGGPYFETESTALRFDSERDDIVNLRKTIWVIGFVRYADIFGRHYISGFSHALDIVNDRFVCRGGDKHNYARKEEPKNIPPGKK